MGTCKLRSPRVHVRLGNRISKTPRRVPGEPWGDTFNFDISLHQHLFWTLQVDLYDSRVLRRHAHLGRSEIRLYKLAQADLTEARWYDLKDRQHSYANLADLGVRDVSLEEYKVGALLLELSYVVKGAAIKEEERGPEEGQETGLRLSVRPNAMPHLPSPSGNEHGTITTSSDEEGGGEESGSLNHGMSSRMDALLAESGPSMDALTLPVSSGSSQPSDLSETSNEVKSDLAASREVNTLLRRISSWVLAEDDSQVVQNLLNEFSGFGQGIEVSRLSLTMAFFLLQRFYRTMDIPYSNNILIGKKDLELVRNIFRYAYAALGWSALYFFGKRSEIFSDVVSSRANYKAVVDYLGMDPDDMLICDLDDHLLFRPNFFVSLDRRQSAVVLSIRGTMSLRDTLTDLSCEYVPWNGGLAHSGMLTAATWFLENIAKQLVVFAQEYGMSNIYVTGHSLGGGTAALTTIMMAEELVRLNSWPKRADGSLLHIHCYSFGTPSVLSAELAAKYGYLVDSFIYGEDIVPRLSYGSMADLQILMVYAAEIGRASDVFHRMPESELYRRLETCRRAILEQKNVVNMKLRVPGTVHHIMRLKAPNHKRYTVIDTCGAERFTEMSLRKKMLQDHLPNRYERGLEEAYVTYLLHELEERQNSAARAPTSIQDKILSVVSLINNDASSDDPDANGQSGSLFPHTTSRSQSPSDT